MWSHPNNPPPDGARPKSTSANGQQRVTPDIRNANRSSEWSRQGKQFLHGSAIQQWKPNQYFQTSEASINNVFFLTGYQQARRGNWHGGHQYQGGPNSSGNRQEAGSNRGRGRGGPPNRSSERGRGRGKPPNRSSERGRGRGGPPNRSSERGRGRGRVGQTNMSSQQARSMRRGRPLDAKDLRDILDIGIEPTEIVMELATERSGWKELLERNEIIRGIVVLLLDVMAKACLCTDSPRNLNSFLAVIYQSGFLIQHLTPFISSLYNVGCNSTEASADEIEPCRNIITLLKTLLRCVPTFTMDEVVVNVTVLEIVCKKNDTFPDEINTEIRQLKAVCDNLQQNQEYIRDREFVRSQNKPPPNDFQEIDIIPQTDELRNTKRPFLRENLIKGQYQNTERYLDVHFRLLKEDFVAPPRGISCSSRISTSADSAPSCPTCKHAALFDPVQDPKMKGEGDKTASSNSSATAFRYSADNTSIGKGSQEVEKETSGKDKADASLFNKLVHNKLVEVTQTDVLDVLHKDSNSPFYSVKSFEELRLKEELLKGVYLMGFNAPSKIQEAALPLLLGDPPKNMIAQSQSGTGKTVICALTMLSRVDGGKQWPQLPPNPDSWFWRRPSSLFRYVHSVVEEMGKRITGIKVRYSVRGQRVARGDKIKEQVVIGTPGTTLDWGLKWRAIDLSKIEVFVLDVADVMIDTRGYQDQSIRIQKKLPKSCQMMLFSTTYGESVREFAEAVIPDPIVIRLRRDEESLENIKQYYVMCNNEEEKYESLANIYGAISIGQAIIFCRTKRTANWLTEKMTRDGHAVGLLSGELQVEQRVAVLKRYKEGKEKVLITTDVLGSGLDIEQVTVVVNFDLPTDQDGHPDCVTYLHRIGNTGRFRKQGLAINFVDGPKSMANMQKIEQHFGRTIHRLAADDAEEIEKIVLDWE